MMSIESLSEKINQLLPQTQCEECGYKGCKPYATAIAANEAEIDLCAPGGIDTLNALANLLDKDPAPYIKTVEEHYRGPSIAIIDESLCIGCVKCINVCPVDAIVGAPKLMHTVIESECTGCELCVPACPMDCISMKDLAPRSQAEKELKAVEWRKRYDARNARLQRLAKSEQQEHSAAKKVSKKEAIAAALARVKAKKG